MKPSASSSSFLPELLIFQRELLRQIGQILLHESVGWLLVELEEFQSIRIDRFLLFVELVTMLETNEVRQEVRGCPAEFGVFQQLAIAQLDAGESKVLAYARLRRAGVRLVQLEEIVVFGEHLVRLEEFVVQDGIVVTRPVG